MTNLRKSIFSRVKRHWPPSDLLPASLTAHRWSCFDGATQAGPADSRAQVDILDVVNDVAVIRVTLENYFGADYVDFHALKKDETGWKIMAKVFTQV
ncbi:nuclear transport factor 2 family protein [uncultured Gemmiger sp.]|uniref:nuclear transport factor 2 family protein n=1 Tax=uncultured Gemmiger sp. TaxID=1623490 RepID=UPI0025FE1666|nr:nuclear transport factor 2 family protein [uncultured Gemmiger sp.]